MSTPEDVWTPEAFSAANEQNLGEAWTSLGKGPGVDGDASNALVRTATGLPTPGLNVAVRARLQPDEVDARIDETLAWFGVRHLPMLWWVGPTTTPEDLGVRLEAHGLAPAGTTPGMGLRLDKLPDGSPVRGNFRVERVTGEAGLRALAHVLTLGFELPPDLEPAVTRFILDLERGESASWRHVVGWAGETPVAAASAFLGSETAGIFNVATLPEARRVGSGAAVTLAVLHQARELGYRSAVLQSSEMGHPVYRRLGFEDHTVYKLYYWAPPDAQGGRQP